MAMTVTTVSLPNATAGTPYSVTLTQAGGVAPISWALTVGTLPTGLSLDSATGVVSGTPTETVAATPLTFEATDSTPVTPQVADSTGLTLTVAAAATLVITTASLPPVKKGAAFSATLTSTGGVAPLTWSIMTGTLPTGLSLNASTGVISGTPTAAGTATVTFEVTDSTTPTPQTATATFSLGFGTITQPVGSAKVNPTASQTFPLMPQCWPLTVVPGSDPVSAEVPPLQVPQQPDATNSEQNEVISEALTQSGNSAQRLI